MMEKKYSGTEQKTLRLEIKARLDLKKNAKRLCQEKQKEKANKGI